MQDAEPVVIDVTGTDIHAENARIRAQGPVCPVVLPDGVRAWSVAGYEAGKQALSDRRFSKDAHRHWTAFANGEIDAHFPLIGWALMKNMNTAYGQAHSRLRRPVARAFTSRRVAAMRPAVDQAVARLLGTLAAVSPGVVVDLKAQFAQPLAADVMFELIGVPVAARETILRGGQARVDTTKAAEEIARIVEQVMAEMAALIEEKRRNPGDDLTSDLVAGATQEDSGLRDEELISTLLFLLGTGTEPVTNLLSNAILAVLTHPDQRQLIDAGQASWSDAIEETLRAEAPVAHLPFRFPTEDVRLGEVTIPAGEPVLMNFAAIGRDPAIHGGSADLFDITRPNKDHLSFGHGVYSCLGMPLARLEAETALPALFDRFPDIALAVPAAKVEQQNTFIMNGRGEVPVILAPTTPTKGS